MPTISVIVPVYNVEPYLHRCVDSILNQNFTDFELILVDDGSPDGCGTICDAYLSHDTRIKVIHKPNGGLSDARNYGIETTAGGWITFIDSDDWVHSEYLERLYQACIENYVDLSYCGFIRTIGEDPIIQTEKTIVRCSEPETLWCKDQVNATVAWGKLYRKSLWKDIRYPVGKIHEDEYTTYKLLFQCDKVAFIDLKMYFYYQNPDSIMGSVWSVKRLDAIDALRSQMIYFDTTNKKKAYEQTIAHLIHVIFKNSNAVKNRNEYFRYEVYLKRMFRQYLVRYEKITGFKDSPDSYWLYREAFPIETRIAPYIKSIVRRIK